MSLGRATAHQDSPRVVELAYGIGEADGNDSPCGASATPFLGGGAAEPEPDLLPPQEWLGLQLVDRGPRPPCRAARQSAQRDGTGQGQQLAYRGLQPARIRAEVLDASAGEFVGESALAQTWACTSRGSAPGDDESCPMPSVTATLGCPLPDVDESISGDVRVSGIFVWVIQPFVRWL